MTHAQKYEKLWIGYVKAIKALESAPDSESTYDSVTKAAMKLAALDRKRGAWAMEEIYLEI